MAGSIQTKGHEMKSVLYGCEDPCYTGDSTPSGKKRLVAESGEIPFATCDQDVKKMFSKDYTKKQRNRSIHEKVGASRIFDPTIYLTNYEESISNRKESSLRNFKGSGDILAHTFTKAERNVSSAIEQTQDLDLEHEDDVTADDE